MMLKLKIDKNNLKPPYRQLLDILLDGIRNGTYKPGEDFPSEQIIGQRYGIHRSTVRRATGELVKRNLIRRIPGKGIIVLEKKGKQGKPLDNFLTIGISSIFNLGNSLNILIKRFQKKHPSFFIKTILLPKDEKDYINVLHSLGQIGNMPDIFLLTEWQFSEFAYRKELLSLDEKLRQSKLFHKDDYYREPFLQFRYQNSQQGIPFIFSPVGLFYNKDMFDTLGIRYPDDKWNWDTFLDIAKRLTIRRDEEGISQYGFLLSSHRNRWPVWIFQNGGKVYDDRNNQCIINTSEATEALQFCLDLMDKHKVALPNVISHYRTAYKIFSQSRVAMIHGSYYGLSALRSIRNFTWDIAPLPYGKEKATLFLGTCFSISKDSHNPDLAWEFIEFLLSSEAQYFLKEKGHAIPVMKSVAEEKIVSPRVYFPQNYNAYLNTMKYMKRVAIVPDLNILSPMIDEMDLVWAKLQTPKNACQRIEEQVNMHCAKIR